MNTNTNRIMNSSNNNSATAICTDSHSAATTCTTQCITNHNISPDNSKSVLEEDFTLDLADSEATATTISTTIGSEKANAIVTTILFEREQQEEEQQQEMRRLINVPEDKKKKKYTEKD
mmetsp:Transcript_1263/g.1381  ORF Transcript_1263/g.1381 Transcript_1263/m.1381 type:complete len:119 (-) Transcript_1263:225-581(-)